MAKLKSIASCAIAKLKQEGRVHPISAKEAQEFNNELAKELEKIKKESARKQRNSIAMVAKMEISSYTE